jgi:hypothetical protein
MKPRAEKVYIQYCRPFKDEDDEPPIAEVWSEINDRPKKKLADGVTLFVYDVEGKNQLVNMRPWDGLE